MATKYKILGISDEQTECDCCNKKNLKRTVALEVWRDNENTFEIIRVGVDCAAILSARNGKPMSAAKIKSIAEGNQKLAELDKQWKADQLEWKIQNRIQPDIAKANDYYLKQYPVYIAGFKAHYGKLLTDGKRFAWIPTINASSTEQSFIKYLIDHNFQPYES